MTDRLTRSGRITLISLFFAWGVMGVMIRMTMPHFKDAFALGYRDAFLIQSAFFATYLLFARATGAVTGRIGLGNGVALGLMLMALGALGLAASTLLTNFYALLPSIFILASGITFLQVSANALASIEGPMHNASSNLTFSQAFNSLGTVVAPLIAGIAFLGASEAPLEPVRWLFAFFAACLAILALAARIVLTYEPSSDKHAEPAHDAHTRTGQPWRLTAAVAAIFLYVGAEVCISTTLLELHETQGFMEGDRTLGAMFVSVFWIEMVAGRFLGTALLERFDRSWILALSALGAAMTCLGSVFLPGTAASVLILASGLFCSVQFPTIFAIGCGDLEPADRARAAGWLCTGICGGGVIPLMYGSLADASSLSFALIVPALCFLAIAGFAWSMRGAAAHEEKPASAD